MGKPLSLVGQKFTMLTVVDRLMNNKDGKSVWLCICDCGNDVFAVGSELKRERKKSCGCAHDKLLSLSHTKHGGSNTAEFKAWSSMKERCLCKSHKSYNNYGARGIVVCNEWLDNYENFLKDMGNKPSRKYSLDRIDNNGGYNKKNCRWATVEEQNRNKRTKANSTSNTKGVFFKKNTGKFEVRIMANKKRIYLGVYDNIEEAIRVRSDAEKYYWS